MHFFCCNFLQTLTNQQPFHFICLYVNFNHHSINWCLSSRSTCDDAVHFVNRSFQRSFAITGVDILGSDAGPSKVDRQMILMRKTLCMKVNGTNLAKFLRKSLRNEFIANSALKKRLRMMGNCYNIACQNRILLKLKRTNNAKCSLSTMWW